MNRNLYTIISIIALFICYRADAYVVSKTPAGFDLWWGTGAKKIYIHSDNSSGLTSGDISSIANISIQQWLNHDVGFDLYLYEGDGVARDSTNDIYFSTTGSYFSGGGVVAVTQSAYKEASGEVVESDIIINDNLLFSSDSSQKLYLGNVITHEMGHFFGLSHSEVKDSTMFYALIKDQWSVAQDDISGLLGIYNSSSLGKISGKIIGGQSSAVGIFGAHVLAVSAKDGSVVSTVSDEDGTFVIKGLDLSNRYYLQVRPLESLSVIPDYYSTVRSDFCYESESYTTHFFEPCELRGKGYPWAIELTSELPSVSVGNITIGCSLSSPSGYLEDLEVSRELKDDGNSMVGYVSAEGEEGVIEIDLSDYGAVSASDYLIVNLLTQRLYSSVKLSLEIYKDNVLIQSVDPGADVDINLKAEIALGTYGTGIYEFHIVADSIITSGELYEGTNTIDDYFPEGIDYVDSYTYYFLTYDVGTRSGSDYSLTSLGNSFTDNSSCYEGNEAFSVEAKVVALSEENEDESGGISCATISTKSDPPGGAASVFIGFMLVLLFKVLYSKNSWNRARFIP